MTNRGLKIRETFRQKYGVDHPSQLLSTKEKIKEKRRLGAYNGVIEKMKKTLKEKYGKENYVNVEKAKQTKIKKYGDPNYNNRDKMLDTIVKKYGMKVSPNTLESTTNRVRKNEIGFGSEKFQQYLVNSNVTNVSQISSIKIQKRNKQIRHAIDAIFNEDRLKGVVTPLFHKNEYKGTEYYILYKFQCCVCKNEFEDTLYSGNIPRCLKCHPHNRFYSEVENEIDIFIKGLGISTERHNRNVLNGNEIDILLPDLKIGIECNGIVWHSELFGKKDKMYHLNKTTMANEKCIRLIHIMDWEWTNKNELIKSIISSIVGKTKRIHARECEIKILSESEKSNFIEKNHIQGNDKSSIKIGLFKINELVSAMTFCKSRYDKKYEYEMSRFCNKMNVSVVGGASKMFLYFIKTYCPSSIVSYCDKRFFSGGVYLACGMKKVKDTPPGYFYFHKNNYVPINRIKFQKHKLKSVLKVYDPALTEWENMQLNGYDRIWDCGHYKYEWIKI